MSLSDNQKVDGWVGNEAAAAVICIAYPVCRGGAVKRDVSQTALANFIDGAQRKCREMLVYTRK